MDQSDYEIRGWRDDEGLLSAKGPEAYRVYEWVERARRQRERAMDSLNVSDYAEEL